VTVTNKARDRNDVVVLHGIEDLRAEVRAVPDPGAAEVLIEIRSVGICGSDVHYFEHGRIGDFVVESPLVLGHESSGVIVEVGDGVARERVGERVALEPGVPCGHCGQCRAGRYNLCPDVRFHATPPIDGTFARFVAIDAEFAHRIPDEVTFDVGALIEPLSVGIWANRKAGTAPGDRVLVTGAGPIGVLCALVAVASGASDVAITDINADRLRQALDLGIPRSIVGGDDAGLAGFAPTVLIDATGVEPVVAAGILALAPAGRAVLVGMGARPLQSLPVARIQARELTVTGTFRYANTYPAAIALAASGRLPLERIVGARVPIADAEAALRMGHTHPEVLKTIVVVSEDGESHAAR